MILRLMNAMAASKQAMDISLKSAEFGDAETTVKQPASAASYWRTMPRVTAMQRCHLRYSKWQPSHCLLARQPAPSKLARDTQRQTQQTRICPAVKCTSSKHRTHFTQSATTQGAQDRNLASGDFALHEGHRRIKASCGHKSEQR